MGEITLGHIEALLAVQEHGSFTKAALALGITQSAVSRTIASLEHRLDRQLVVRGPDGATVSASGREILHHARNVVKHLRMIEDANPGKPTTLRIGAVASALNSLVPTTVKELCSAWPGLDVLVVQGDDDELTDWLTSSTIDLAVSTVPIGDPAETVTITDEFLAVLPKDHRLTRCASVTVAELVAAGTVDPGGTCGPLLSEYFAQQGVNWKPLHTVRATSAVFSMVGAGITAGVVPAMATPRPIPPGVVLRPFHPGLHRTIYLSRDSDNEYARDFTNLLITNNQTPLIGDQSGDGIGTDQAC